MHVKPADGKSASRGGWLNLLKKYFGTICGIDMASSAKAEELQVKRGQFYIDLGKTILATTGKAPPAKLPRSGRWLRRLPPPGPQDARTGHIQTGKKQGERAGTAEAPPPDFPCTT